MHTPQTVENFIGRMTGGMPSSEDRRDQERHPLSVVVEVQPLDEQMQPAGSPFQAVTRDISGSGIGIVHNGPIESRFLSVGLTSADGQELQTVIEVVRSRPLGGIHDIGGRFLTAESADA